MNQKKQLKLSVKEQSILKTIGVTKLTWSAIKIYKKLCPTCRIKIVGNPKLNYEEYCLKCQYMAYEILRSYLPKKEGEQE